MRIGLLPPPFERVPPIAYGGTERVVAALADALVARGHDVSLFATADSRTRARLVPTAEAPVWHDARYRDDGPFRAIAVARAYRDAQALDVVHNHLDFAAFPAARLAAVPTVTTLHWVCDAPELGPLYEEFAEQPLVSVSDAQRAPLPHANWIATVYHGLPAGRFRPGTGRGGYLAFCGRFTPEKGLHRAIEVALAAGIPVKIAARRPPEHSDVPVLRAERAYYEATLAHWLGHPLVDYVGELSEEDKQAFYGDALALVFPIDWREPFGLVLIEALACGTPVLASPVGSVPEIVRPGVGGFHCASTTEFVDAIAKVRRLDRSACRAEFDRRFTAERMAAAYERVYETVIARRADARAPRRAPPPASSNGHRTRPPRRPGRRSRLATSRRRSGGA